MKTFDVQTLQVFLEEQKDFFLGARISKIQQPTRREIVFTIRNNGENRQLYINISPQMYHICFMSKETTHKRMLEIPQKPPMFCMQLRKYLEGAKIINVNQPEGERIIEIHIEANNIAGECIYPCLVVELMGKHSNVILYNSDTGIIIGSAHNVGADKSRIREVYGGIPYIYPPKQVNFSINEFKSLMSEFDKNTYSDVNSMIDNYYANLIYQYKYEALKSKYSAIVIQKFKKVSRTLLELKNQSVSVEKIDKYRLYGDLLMANMYQLKDFLPEIELYDYENNKKIIISLDKSKTIKENANRYYKLYNKGKNARIKLVELGNKYAEEKDYLEHLLYSINTAKNFDDLVEISSEILPDTTNIKTQKTSLDNIKCVEKGNETKIYIGKNNKQNDYIISKLASDNDIWFHVHNNAGSHVLLKTQNLTDDLILYCARLAKENSSVKDSSKIGVIYTKRKYLRKPPGAKLGYVTYKKEKEIVLD